MLDFMLFGFLDAKTIFIILHVFGAIIGAGGAFASDGMFFNSVRDGRISREELRFLRMGSRMVWTGLALLAASGLLLFLTEPLLYMSSSKFMAKITIVGVIILNGFIFHLIHLPRLRAHAGTRFADSPAFIRNASFLMASGAISMVSWTATVILGVLRRTPYDYGFIVGAYGLVLALAIACAMLMKRRVLHVP